MSGVAATDIDWAKPWFAPYRAAGAQVWASIRSGQTVIEALNQPALRADAGGDLCPRFVRADAAPPDGAYESFVHASRTVPTRDNLHDVFNALVWLVHPALKWRLNALQAEQLRAHGVQAARGPLRDAVTLFDESGALLQASPTLQEALHERQWRQAFVALRSQWQEATVTVVGHALLEKLAVAPRKALTAHALLVSAADLDAQAWSSKPFVPLPVMGVPGWDAAQHEAGYYDDQSVFRPKAVVPRAPRAPAGRSSRL